MRLLHTADWHLGRTLHGHSRRREQEQFVDELVSLAAGADAVLIAGDVYETANPPIEAEQLLFDALARLGDGGRRAVIVIAGNHDAPDRLRATAPLATRHGVWVLGRPGDVPLPRVGQPGVSLADPAPGLLDLVFPDGRRLVVGALPYPSEARLRQVLSVDIGGRDQQAAYEERVAAVFSELARQFRPDAVNVLVSHLAVSECMPSGSERALVGGAWQVSGRVFPAAAQYVALGHLHLAQEVPAACPARYSGAPMPFRFSEREHPREVVQVDAEPGQPAVITRVPLSAGRPLVSWEASSIEEVEQGVADGRFTDAWIDLSLRVGARLTPSEVARVQRLSRDIVRLRAVLPDAVAADLAPSQRRELPIDQVFRAFYAGATGCEPDPELVRLFVELSSP
jgi:exonuclease SbcD